MTIIRNCIFLSFLHFLSTTNGEYAETRMMQQWSNLHQMVEQDSKLKETPNPFDDFYTTPKFDLLFPPIPHGKPVDSLNLTDDCADDVQFYRNNRDQFIKDMEIIKLCGKNDSCKSAATESIKKVVWTAQQMDAFGKIPPGVLHLNTYWYGSYDECRSINQMKPVNFTNRAYQGKYCYAMMALRSLFDKSAPGCPPETDDSTKYGQHVRWALCVPSSCTRKDTMKLVQQYDKLKPVTCNVFCIEEKEVYTAGAIAMILVFSLIGATMVISTVVDYILQHCLDNEESKNTKHILLRLLLCFSIYTNGMKIMDMSKRSGQLECLHGIRVMSMLWVILGHTYLHVQYVDNIVDVYKVKNDWSMEVINNATFSVDTFFTLSGFLVAYLWLKEEEKKGSSFVKSKKTWISYYLHRYIRLTPVFMLILGMNGALMPYFIRGPHQYDVMANTGKDCAETWWTNLIYVNNIVKSNNQCYGPAWYLPNDMQFYALAPLILLLLLYSPGAGFFLSAALILGSMAGTAATIVVYKFPPMPIAGAPTDKGVVDASANLSEFMRLVYMAPWTRFPTYLIGLLFGYLWQKRLCRVKMNKLMALVVWCMAFAVALAVLYGLTDYVRGNQLPVGIRALYGAVSRPVWSLCICWLVFACLTGCGGPINEFLSWRGWLPLSRLSYCTYLLHYSIIEILFASNDFPFHWDTHLNWISKWISATVVTMFASFFVSCALEAPIIGIEKLILHPETNPKKAVVAPEPLCIVDKTLLAADVVYRC